MKVPARQNLASMLALGLALLANGCTTFNREWKATATQPTANSLAGRWEGSWLSDQNGHHGNLRCVLSRASDDIYDAHFHATYWKIFSATYSVRFTGEIRDGVWHFNGSEDLGTMAGGVYHYEGRLTPTNFFSAYRCKFDHGTFELSRPK